MAKRRRFLIPTWVLVLVLVVFGLPNAIAIWSGAAFDFHSPDPTVLVIMYFTELLLLMPPWLALGMLIRRLIRPSHQGHL